jgi:hypothetical protein
MTERERTMVTRIQHPGPMPPKKSSTALVVVAVMAVVVVALIVAAYFVVSTGAGMFGNSDKASWDYTLEHRTGLAPYSPEDGKEFVIATIFLKNDGWAGVDTNAYQWNYAVGGITYSASIYTFFSDSITYDSVTVNTGGSATFQIVFEVPSGLGDGVVRYDGYSSTTVIRDPALL